MTEALRFLMIVDDPEIAAFVADNGVDRVFVDLEFLGKDVRQKDLASWRSRQTVGDVSKIREAIPDSHLLVRVNPIHDGSAAEIADVLARGADSVMLPMFHTWEEVARFYDLLNDRAVGVPLFETGASLKALPDIIQHTPIREAHIGMVDLHLDLGMRFVFEPLALGMLDEPCRLFREADIAFGIGGVARAGEGAISPDHLLGEHVRLGSTAAILSRTFHRGAATLADLQEKVDFGREVDRLREIYAHFAAMDEHELTRNKATTIALIKQIAGQVPAR